MALLISIAAIHLLALLSPGPDFFFVTQTAISRPRRDAMAGALGISLGVAAWAGLALLGLQVLLQRIGWLGQLLTLAGGLYLAWMGVSMLRQAWRHSPKSGPVAVESNGLAAMLRGLLTNLANPKVAIYFASIFSALVGGNVSISQRGVILSLVTIETFLWFASVATVFGLASVRRAYLRAQRWIDAASGAIFVLFGLALALHGRLA